MHIHRSLSSARTSPISVATAPRSSLSFVVPMVIIMPSSAWSSASNRTDSGPSGIPLAVVNQSDSTRPRKSSLDALQAEKSFRVITTFVNPDKTTRPLTEADLRPMIRDRQFSYALVIPADLLSDDDAWGCI